MSSAMPIPNSPITRFREENFFLSNFYRCPISFCGIIYPSSEHAYQAAKTLDPTERHLICNQATPGNAKRAGRRITQRPDWNQIKLTIMETILRIKFTDAHNDLAQKLIATRPREIQEVNYWNDTFWGICNGIGQNHLGRLLMKIRREIST